MLSMDEFFRNVLGKPALCFGSMASRPEPQLDSVKALNELGNITDRSIVGLEGRCEAGDAKSCLAAGLLVMEGQGAMQDFRRAAKLLDSACQRGVPKACFSLGRLNDGVRAMDGSSLPVDSAQVAIMHSPLSEMRNDGNHPNTVSLAKGCKAVPCSLQWRCWGRLL
jgi:TPR repeat protein